MCPPERPRSGVSIPKYIYASRIMHEDLTMDAPLQGDTGGHTGAAPTHLRYIFPHKQNNHLHTIRPKETNRPCAIRPYPSPSYFSTQSHTNKIPSMRNSPQTKSTVHVQSVQAKCVGAAPVCPPERPHSGVSISKNTRIVCGDFNDGCTLAGRRGRAHRHRPYPSPSNIVVCHYPLYIR